MGIVEIVLIIAGAVICILGYLMPSRKEDVDETLQQLISEDEIRKVVDKEIEDAKTHIVDVVDETITYAMEKTERSMERVTNEKIMAVNEYSDTVLEEINKNHKEVLFLYDMLNDKHDNLKNTVSEATQTAEEIKQTVRDAEITAKETQESVKDVENTVREAEDAVRAVMNAALEAKERSTAPVYAEIPNIGAPEFGRDVPDIGTPEFDREVPDIGTPEFHMDVPDIGTPEFRTEVPDIGVPEFVDEETDIVEIETDRETAHAEAMEVARAASYTGKAEAADQFVPITPPRVEIIHDPDSEYDYIAEPSQTEENVPVSFSGKQEELRSVAIQFANGKNNGRNSNERILELHKAGKSNMAIAKELGLGIGEVKLVIDLFEGL
ncbi:MAG: DivIVA domain-containing protein [Lachnospiraceae bacterium]|nr:DivIVA domain-containing protein [Lachnospiraceae bacterium]